MKNVKILITEFKDYLLITTGSLITAMAINVFMVPYKIAPGGISGIATVIYYITDAKVPVGTAMLILNVPLFMMGIRLIGKKFTIKTLYGTILLSLLIDATQPLTDRFVENYLASTENYQYTPDILLYSIFGGLLMGIGLGLVLRSGATTGGTDLAARIVNYVVPAFTMGETLLFIDTGIIVFAAFVFRSVQLALYSIVTLYISSKIIDAILEGVNFAKALLIISDSPQEIATSILKDLDRGVTALKGKGMFTGNDKEVLFCVVQRRQIPMVKKIARDIDKKAFIVLTDIREVLGEGFKTYD
ncbi:MAG TPA: YitT family protein [Acetivibrio sp.]|uniref:YitT family protein n=1 Tax=Acetivibrio sp. TaxID=1872092 RepID=UPI002BBEF0AB|nr:YitT family protein [Acetivibrio sp.]HOM02308.1 YitT family protein [Acetivibrio sp.]